MDTAFLPNIRSILYLKQAFLKIEKKQKIMLRRYNDDLKRKIADLKICGF